MAKHKAKKHPRAGRDTLVVGIDIGKFFHWVAVTHDEEPIQRFKIFNEGRGFIKLLKEIQRLQRGLKCAHVLIGVEPTGHYWYPLAYYLEKHRQGIVLVNPAHVRWAKELEDNSPLKSDPKDAGIIADLVGQGKYMKIILPKGVYAHLSKLSAMRDQRMKKQSAHKNILHRILDVIFPEFGRLFSDLLGKTAKVLLRQYPTPGQLKVLSEKKLADLLRKASHGRLGEAKAQQLLEAAQGSIGVTEGLESYLLDLSQTLDSLEVLGQQIAQIEQRQEAYLARVPYAAYVLSIPGIGVVTAATLLGETGDLQGYTHARELIKLAGLNLYEVSSGIHKGQRRITKRGRRRLRKILYCAMIPLIRHNSVFRAKYQALRARGKASQPAMIALCGKLLRVIFALVRTQQTFSEHSVYEGGLRQAA
jgi:transposase